MLSSTQGSDPQLMTESLTLEPFNHSLITEHASNPTGFFP
jgi:hypothetical protein